MKLVNLLVGWTDLFPADSDYYWMEKVFGPISIVMYILMGLVGAAGAVYAIYLGIMLAKAEDQSKRDEARKHLITVLIAVAVTIVLVLFFNLLMPIIVQSLIGKDINNPNTPGTDNAAKLIIQAVKAFLH